MENEFFDKEDKMVAAACVTFICVVAAIVIGFLLGGGLSW